MTDLDLVSRPRTEGKNALRVRRFILETPKECVEAVVAESLEEPLDVGSRKPAEGVETQPRVFHHHRPAHLRVEEAKSSRYSRFRGFSTSRMCNTRSSRCNAHSVGAVGAASRLRRFSTSRMCNRRSGRCTAHSVGAVGAGGAGGAAGAVGAAGAASRLRRFSISGMCDRRSSRCNAHCVGALGSGDSVRDVCAIGGAVGVARTP